MSEPNTSKRAADWLRKIADMVEAKGRMYGDSIGKPVRVFSNLGVSDGLRARCDDKLARIKSAQPDDQEDAIADLVGYCALLATAEDSK